MLRGGVEGKLLIGHMEHSCVLLLYPNSVCQQWQAERQHPELTLSANTGDMICRGVGGPFVLERPGQSLKLELGIFIKACNRRSGPGSRRTPTLVFHLLSLTQKS